MERHGFRRILGEFHEFAARHNRTFSTPSGEKLSHDIEF